ncbi:MAG: hypothetical protein KBD21_03035 [Candidatus Pacebacteria bacterium]|nr:hypothetical protein [Candidatus Paceibacterota bacterium]
MQKNIMTTRCTSQVLAQVLALILLCLPVLVFGAETQSFDSPVEGDLYDLLVKILNAVVYILFPFIVLMIVYTGFLFVTAQGNATKITQAREALVWTVVGALVVLGAKAIALAIEATVAEITG